VAQGLEISKVKGLNVDNVASFYANLEKLYELHPTSRIVMSQEHKLDVVAKGESLQRKAHISYTIIPKERKWLSVLTCINVAATNIPNSYIFKGKWMCKNYIKRCENGATMAMQSKAWMTNQLCANWIVHFVMLVNDGMEYISHLSF